VNRPKVGEGHPNDGPAEVAPIATEEEGLPPTAAIAAQSRETMLPSPLPPFTAGHHPSTSTSQTVPEDRVGALTSAQSLESISSTPQGVHAFTGENLDLAVAGGNLTKVVERHSHTHFHLSPQWNLGKSLLHFKRVQSGSLPAETYPLIFCNPYRARAVGRGGETRASGGIGWPFHALCTFEWNSPCYFDQASSFRLSEIVGVDSA
jgi:hypothetical protein